MLVGFLVALPVGALAGRLPHPPAARRRGRRRGMVLAAGRLRPDGRVGADQPRTTWSPPSRSSIAGLGFGLALAPVNAALLAATDDAVHGVTSALLVVARMVGMLVGISALTTIGLRRYYAVQVDLPPPTRSAAGTRCAAYTDLLKEAGHRAAADGLRRRRGVRGGRGGAGARAVPRRRHPGRHARGRCAGRLLPSRDLTTSTTCSPPTATTPTTFDARRLRRRRPRRRRHGDLHGLPHRPAADARACSRATRRSSATRAAG